jgi:hypothetical protein
MLYYIAHLCLIVILNFSLVFILSEEKVVTDQLWIIWLATFLIIVALYPLVKKFPDFRKKHVKAWPLLNYF